MFPLYLDLQVELWPTDWLFLVHLFFFFSLGGRPRRLKSLGDFITNTHLAFSSLWDIMTNLRPAVWGGVGG